MFVFWQYMCDHGHRWSFFRESEAVEAPGDTVCPHGHEAVTLQKSIPTPGVELTLRPAEQIADAVTGKVILKGKYYLVLRKLPEGVEIMSAYPHNWDEAAKFISQVRSLPYTNALKVMNSLDSSFGRKGT
jgi:hypothetical protein